MGYEIYEAHGFDVFLMTPTYRNRTILEAALTHVKPPLCDTSKSMGFEKSSCDVYGDLSLRICKVAAVPKSMAMKVGA